MLVMLPSMRAFMPWLAYFSNRDYYSEICINKSKPELHCNGACHARMEVAAAQESDESRIPRPPFVEVEEVLFVGSEELPSLFTVEEEVQPHPTKAIWRFSNPFQEIPVPPPWVA